MRRYGLVVLLISLLNIESAQADFAAGAQAYDGGDYATAFNEWQEPAKTGNLAAMVALADLYRRGTGRKPNAAHAFQCYRRAALAGDAIAQMNLGEMHLRGWGIKTDRFRAWVWFDRAATQGRDWAREQKNMLEKSMSSAQLAKARKIGKIEK
ncbi:MAG: tetratricopeptide repeat protein [Alphaproteobacteria bacterium]